MKVLIMGSHWGWTAGKPKFQGWPLTPDDGDRVFLKVSVSLNQMTRLLVRDYVMEFCGREWSTCKSDASTLCKLAGVFLNGKTDAVTTNYWITLHRSLKYSSSLPFGGKPTATRTVGKQRMSAELTSGNWVTWRERNHNLALREAQTWRQDAVLMT